MTSTHIRRSAYILFGALSFGGCGTELPQDTASEQEAQTQNAEPQVLSSASKAKKNKFASKTKGQSAGENCGGVAGLQCAQGLRCIDRMDDGCDPKNGGYDCPATCTVPCDLSSPEACADTQRCVDNPQDSCWSDEGDENCENLCLSTEQLGCQSPESGTLEFDLYLPIDICEVAYYSCGSDTEYFLDDCGCGCIKAQEPPVVECDFNAFCEAVCYGQPVPEMPKSCIEPICKCGEW